MNGQGIEVVANILGEQRAKPKSCGIFFSCQNDGVSMAEPVIHAVDALLVRWAKVMMVGKGQQGNVGIQQFNGMLQNVRCGDAGEEQNVGNAAKLLFGDGVMTENLRGIEIFWGSEKDFLKGK